MFINEDELYKNLLADIKSNRLVLPSLPEIAIRIREMTANPDCLIPQVVEAINSDAAIAARLLKVANSALLRTKDPIESIHGAVMRLGLKQVRTLVSQLALLQSFSCYSNIDQKQLRELTEHSLEVGSYCHSLASQRKPQGLDPEEAMLAGLVHDIGKLPILTRLHDMLGSDIDSVDIKPILHQLHGSVGGIILKEWSFPPQLIEVAMTHEELDRPLQAPVDYTDLVIVANLHCHLLHDDAFIQGLNWDNIPSLQKMVLNREDLLENQSEMEEYQQQTSSRFNEYDSQASADISA